MYTLYSVGASEKLNLTGSCAVRTLSKRSMQATQFIDCVQYGMCFVATMSSLGLSYVLSCSPFVSMKSYKILLAPSRAQSFSELLRCDTFTVLGSVVEAFYVNIKTSFYACHHVNCTLATKKIVVCIYRFCCLSIGKNGD